MKIKKIPEVGKTYNCFDDGKISESRLYTVDVVAVIPYNKVDSETLDIWKHCVKESYWLFAKDTDFFVKTENGEDGDAVFTRTTDGGWFSMGGFMNSGRMDVDGSLTEYLKNGR